MGDERLRGRGMWPNLLGGASAWTARLRGLPWAWLALVGLGAHSLAACEPGSPARTDRQPTTSSAPSRLRRLSAREIRLAFRDLTDVEIDEARLPERADAVGYDNGPGLLDFSYDDTEKIASAAEYALREATRRHEDWVSPACARGEHADPAVCRTKTLAVAARAFRRPLTPEDESTLGALYDARLAERNGPRPFETTLLAAFMSPSFLYREEIGTSQRWAPALLPHEIAVSLAFMTTGSAPDEELTATARDGTIADPEVRRREASRLLASPRGRDTLRAFLEQWLEVRNIDRVAKDASVYPEFRAELAVELIRDVRATVDDTLAREGSLAALFTTRAAFPGKRLGAIYGVKVRTPFERVELDESRAGILTRAGLLSVHSASDGSGPIARGLAVRASLLCATLPPPPPGIARAVPSEKARTTRERFAEHTGNPRCQGCHSRIDGVGFGFEGFDGIGRARREEKGVPIDDSGMLFDADVADGPFRGVVELEQKVLTSEALRTCFVKHAMRFAFGHGESEADTALVHDLREQFSASRPIASLFADIAAHEAFVRRSSP